MGGPYYLVLLYAVMLSWCITFRATRRTCEDLSQRGVANALCSDGIKALNVGVQNDWPQRIVMWHPRMTVPDRQTDTEKRSEAVMIVDSTMTTSTNVIFNVIWYLCVRSGEVIGKRARSEHNSSMDMLHLVTWNEAFRCCHTQTKKKYIRRRL